MKKKADKVTNADIADVEAWLKALEDGKISDFNVRDPYLLRAIGIAQNEYEDATGRGASVIELDKLDWNVAYAVSTAIDKGETWYGVARALGVPSTEAKARFERTVERLKIEREQIAEEQEMDAQQREDDEADMRDLEYDDREYDDPYSVPFEDLSEEDQLAAGRLADAVAAFEPLDTSKVREGGLIIVVNNFDARYEDRVLRVAMNEDGQLEKVLLAGPPNHWISFSSSAGWKVTGYTPPQYKEGWVGWATVQTEEGVTEEMFGMWVTLHLRHEQRIQFTSSTNGRYYMPSDVRGFRQVRLLHPGPLADFEPIGAQWLYEFGQDAQGTPDEERVDWALVTGKSFYANKLDELVQLLKDKLDKLS